MDSLANLIGNISTGGILGLVGSIGSGVLNYFQTKQAALDALRLELTQTDVIE